MAPDTRRHDCRLTRRCVSLGNNHDKHFACTRKREQLYISVHSAKKPFHSNGVTCVHSVGAARDSRARRAARTCDGVSDGLARTLSFLSPRGRVACHSQLGTPRFAPLEGFVVVVAAVVSDEFGAGGNVRAGKGPILDAQVVATQGSSLKHTPRVFCLPLVPETRRVEDHIRGRRVDEAECAVGSRSDVPFAGRVHRVEQVRSKRQFSLPIPSGLLPIRQHFPAIGSDHLPSANVALREESESTWDCFGFLHNQPQDRASVLPAKRKPDAHLPLATCATLGRCLASIASEGAREHVGPVTRCHIRVTVCVRHRLNIMCFFFFLCIHE